MTRVYIIIKILFLIALGLLSVISSQIIDNLFWKGVFSNIGSAILVAGILTVISEYLLKKELIEYILDKIKLKTQISSSGLEEIYSSASEIDYISFLNNSKDSIDVVHINGAEWIGRHVDDIKKILKTKRCTIQVFLMSPRSVFLESIAEHFSKTKEEIVKTIEYSVEVWKGTVEDNEELKGKLKIYFHYEHPTSSLVRVDDRIINIQNKLVSGKSKRLLCTIIRSTGQEDDIFNVLFNEIKGLEQRSELVFESQ